MKAQVGDRLIIRGHVIPEAMRDGEILEVGPDGEPPFLVRWEDGRTSLVFPGPDALIQHFEEHHASAR
jgi:hypothetical protein